jgi:putative oxidoreductase
MRNRPVYDVVALLARCGIGAVFLIHGWQKIQVGVTATGRSFDAIGVPSPTAAAIYATFVELLGGAALILGLAIPVMGTLLILDMAAAMVFANAGHVMFVVNGRDGFELVLVLALATLVFTAGGAGRLTLDHWLFGRRSVALPPATRPAASKPAAPPRPAAEMTVNRDVVVAGKKKEEAKEP